MRTSLLLTSLLLSTPAAFSQTTTFCGAEVNSTGVPALITTTGSLDVVQNAFGLRTVSLPADTFGVYLVNDQSFTSFTPPGSDGNLCLANPAGGASPGLFSGSILPTGPTGIAAMPVDLTGLPLGSGVAVAPGDTFNFQFWFRDENSAGQRTNNFSDAVAVTFDPPAVSFATDIWNGIFSQPGVNGGTLRCTDCHGNPNPSGGLDLRTSAATAYSNLVLQNAQGSGATCVPFRVDPGNANGSLLVQVLEMSCNQVAQGMTPPMGQADIDTIRAWIDAGAPNN